MLIPVRITKMNEITMDRRAFLSRSAAIGLIGVSLPALLAACEADDDDDEVAAVDDDDDDDDDEPVDDDDDDDEVVEEPDDDRYGGTLQVASEQAPPSLDVHSLAPAVTREVCHQMIETLLAYDEEYIISPGLAAGWEWSEDGGVVTLDLRDDVLFHDGEPMVADDVVASIDRYIEIGHRAVVEESVQEARVIDDYTVEIELQEPDAGFTSVLASPLVYLGIMSKARIEGKGSGELDTEDIIGTGPFKLEEWIGDVHVRMSRFDDYYQTEGERDGYTGAKVAYLDEVVYQTVVESGGRVSGLLAGEYDIIMAVPAPEIDRLEDHDDVSPEVGGPGWWPSMEFNHHPDAGISSNRTFRQAVQAAIDLQVAGDLMTGGFEELYDMNPSLYRRDQELWWTDVAADLWNQADPDRARELLEESGYDGEEVVIIHSDPDHYRAMALHLSDTLEDLGVNVRADEYDWPGQQAAIEEPEGWQVVMTGMTLRFTPFDWTATWRCATERQFWCNEEMEEIFDELAVTLDEDDQKPLSDEIQRIHHEEVFSIKMPDYFDLQASRNEVQGYQRWYLDRYWGVWKE